MFTTHIHVIPHANPYTVLFQQMIFELDEMIFQLDELLPILYMAVLPSLGQGEDKGPLGAKLTKKGGLTHASHPKQLHVHVTVSVQR